MPAVPLLHYGLVVVHAACRGGAEGAEQRVLHGQGGALVQCRVRVRPPPCRVGGRRQVRPHGAAHGGAHRGAIGGRVEALLVHGPGPHGAHAGAAPPPAPSPAPSRRRLVLVRGAERGAEGGGWAGRGARGRAERGAERGAWARWLARNLNGFVDVAHHLLELRRALGLLLVVQGDLFGELSRRRHPGPGR